MTLFALFTLLGVSRFALLTLLAWLLLGLTVLVEGLVGAGERLLGGVEVVVPDAFEAGEDLLHLVAGIGVVELEVLLIFEEAFDLADEAFVGVGDAAGNLALDGLGVGELVSLIGG